MQHKSPVVYLVLTSRCRSLDPSRVPWWSRGTESPGTPDTHGYFEVEGETKDSDEARGLVNRGPSGLLLEQDPDKDVYLRGLKRTL